MISNKFTICILLLGVCEVLCDEKSSLVFVIDDTGSMTDDIEQVKLSANAIFDTVLKSNESQIEDFVLVTFNDPGTKLRTITRDRVEFKRALSAISTHGGGDCPEYAMSGIFEGIRHSRPGSTIYAFTDASASDYGIYNEVKNIAIKKQIQVVFVLTGMCGPKSSIEYQVYEKLANDTVGEIFHLHKQEINEILRYVIENIKGRKTILAVKSFPPGTHSMNVNVDRRTKDTTVSVTGHKPILNITKPNGDRANTESIVAKDNIVIDKILEPKPPGVYRVEVSSGSDTHVIVSARTDVKFQYGFSTFKPISIDDTTTTPVPDVKSHITIKLTDGDLKLLTIQILDKDDNVIKEVPLTAVNEGEKFYTTGFEDLPNTIFKIAIIGYDPDSRETIRRIGPSIAPQPKPKADILKKAPSVIIMGPSTQKTKWKQPLQLKCNVMGYPQPSVVWVDKDSGDILPATVYVKELPYDYFSIIDIDEVLEDSSYQCKADNPLGSDSTSVAVDIIDPPYFNILKIPKDKSIKYHAEGELNCQVDAHPPATITWYKNNKYLLPSDNVEISEDKSVVKIKKMSPYDDGAYICEVRNAIKRYIFTAKYTTTGVERPIIDDHVKSITMPFGSDVVIPCKIIKGIPKPKIRWDYRRHSEEATELDEFNNQQAITIRNADDNNAGVYSCLASNEIGNDYHEVNLIIEYPLQIKKDVEVIRLAEGNSTVILCEVKGKPDPEIKWYKDDVLLSADHNIYIYKDYSLKITARVSDSGKYTCKATNKFGTVSKVVKLDVYVPATITLPKQTKMEVNVGNTLHLPCQANGHPTPYTEWIYYSFDPSIPSKSMQESVGPSIIKLKNMQVDEEGYYTCVATNSGGSKNITYEIHVLAPPIIENMYINKQFKAVEGDLALMIKCKASGNPPPVITWWKDGFWIAVGDDFSIDNGTLIIQKITKDAEGIYVCEAKNSLGVDRELYQVIVGETPQPGIPTSTVVVGEDRTAAVKCDVPHKRTDLLRWYKNGMLIQTGELTITKAKLADSGLYTCRVSDFAKSTSGNTLVKVGVKPSFVRDETENIEYIEGTPYALLCETRGDPKPEMRWWHNGEMMNTTEDFHYFEMEVGTHGQYVCEAKNEFGHAVRTFNVTSTDCIIDIKRKPSKLQPLMVSGHLQWPASTVKNGYMSISKVNYVVLFCPTRFKAFPKQNVIAFCGGGTKFIIQGQTFDYSDIECTEKYEHLVESTGETCFNDNSVLLSVGYRVLSETVEAYDVCFDTAENKPLYTTMRMSSSAADVHYSETKWADEEIDNLNFSDAYKCDRQINVISANLRRWFHRDDGCCFSKRMLVNPKDLFPGVAQRATYSHLNVIPHWSTCNAESNNWNEVEQRVRSLAKATYSELLVSTGVAEHLSLPDSTKSPQDVFITDGYGNRQAIPKYLWKVVQDPATKSSLVIIQVNIPDLLPSEAAGHVRCRDICNTTSWMKSSDWYDTRRGFTYCCTLKDFEDSFGYRGIFQPFNKVLKDVSLVSETSLT